MEEGRYKGRYKCVPSLADRKRIGVTILPSSSKVRYNAAHSTRRYVLAGIETKQ